ncbi:MAG: aminopeptidase [Deltaproteobacteria bacterium]|nr:aminopeptidase [Deltaproteobacteria bacterium]
MFTNNQLGKYADVLIWALKKARTGTFKKKDIVIVRYSIPALGLAEILHAKLLKMGMNPILRANPTSVMERDFYDISNDDQLVFLAPGDKELIKNVNGSIFLHAPESITHLSHINPQKIGKVAISRKHLRDIMVKREEEGHFGWTLCMLPTKELARHAKISMKEYTSQIINACFLNKSSPVKEWQTVFDKAKTIKQWLNRMNIDTLHIESERIDLEIKLGEKRRWIGISGHNIPSFELFMSPDWRGTKGIYYANQPSYRTGNYVKGLKVEFQKGVATKVHAQAGENFARKQLLMDDGAKRIGEFSLTDKRFSKITTYMANTLFDENYGGKYGNCHIALGASYSDTYAGNPKELTKAVKIKLGFNDSALHWDIVNTENKRVSAKLLSGKKITIYENGKFTY